MCFLFFEIILIKKNIIHLLCLWNHKTFYSIIIYAKIETSLHISGKIYYKRKGLLLWIKIEKQVHSFLYQNQLIASGYIVNFLRDNLSREVGVKIKNHKKLRKVFLNV